MPRQATVAHATNKAAVLTKAVVNTADYLGITKTKLAHVIGVSPATVSRLYGHGSGYQLNPSSKEWDFAVLLVRMFRSLDSIVGGSTEDAKKWMHSRNKAFADRKPVEVIESTEGLVRVVTYLDAYRAVI